MNDTIHILLATYNGEQFIREQLNSLVQQTFNDFTILVRDDGSKDATLNIVSEYNMKHPGKFILIEDAIKNDSGATGNFAILLENSSADYIFFCDQDDIWESDKVEKELVKIRALENEDRSNPCIVFSDMKVIDEDGSMIAESVWKELNLHPDYFILNRLLIQNIPHGCTMAINKAMRNLACPVPKEAILHDHWISLLAACCGNWDFIETPTVLLRNHSQNVTRKKVSAADKLKRFAGNLFSKEAYEYFINIRVAQAKALKTRCASNITKAQLGIIDDFISLNKSSGFKRKRLFLRNKFYRTTFWHTFKMIFRA